MSEQALLVPFQVEFARLTTIPGISTTAAQVLLAEIAIPSANQVGSIQG